MALQAATGTPYGFSRRRYVRTLVARLREEPRWLNVVAGPRQTGKTTLVRHALSEIRRPWIHVLVDEPDSATVQAKSLRRLDPLLSDIASTPVNQRDARWLVRTWEKARFAAETSDRGFVLALDEIQQIADWPRTVKGLWDSDRIHGRRLRVVLLSSAPLLMQRGASESLVGRFEVIDVRHWSFSEMSEAFDFNLDQFLYFGGYPGPAKLIPEEARWRTYIRDAILGLTIKHDLLAHAKVRKPILLKRLLQFGAWNSGQVLAYRKMLGQLGDKDNAATMVRYLDLLSSVGLIAEIPKYVSQPFRSAASSPKLNVLNTGLISTYSGYSLADAQANRTFWGRLTESAVGAHLVNTSGIDCRVYYWREDGAGVDFVLQRGPKLIAFKVKSGRRRGSLRGLERYNDRFSPLACHVVGAGGIPVQEFVLRPAPEWFDGS